MDADRIAPDIAEERPPAVAVVLSVLAALLAIPQAFLLGDVVAVAVLGAGAGTTGLGLAALAAGLAATGLARVLADAASTHLAARHAVAVKRRLRAGWLAVAARWSPLAADRPATGEVASTLVDRVETLDPYLTRYPLARVRMVVVPVAVVLAILPVSWLAALLLTLAGPVIPVLMSLIGARARELGRRQIDETATLSSLLLDRVRGLATLEALGAVDRVADEMAASGEELRRRTMSVLSVAFLSSAVLEFFAAVGIALAAVYVGFRLMGWVEVGGSFGLAGGTAILVLAPEFFQPLRDFAAAYHDRATALSLADRAAGAFRPDLAAMPAGAGRREAVRRAVAVEVDGLAVDAPDGRRLLDGVRLSVRPGERVALVGPSGAGKSLLLMSIAGLAVPAAGTVRVDGRSHAAGAPSVGWVGQEPFVLHGSVLANLGRGTVPASREDAAAALATVGLAEVVGRMPRGPLTPLGETGAGLSRGELRRLTIARVLAAGDGLVLADEPTADLDAATAAEVAAALLAATEGRTLVVATHDAGLAARMDRVVRIEGGRLSEDGR